jgi:hypothetical protein
VQSSPFSVRSAAVRFTTVRLATVRLVADRLGLDHVVSFFAGVSDDVGNREQSLLQEVVGVDVRRQLAFAARVLLLALLAPAG